jgi:hypothetical protein
MGATISGKMVSAIAAAIFLVVFVLMPKGERMKGVAFFVGWLVPGAGHVLLGRWKKGLFFFAILGATYLFGMWIAGFRPVSFDDNPFYFVGQYGSGLTLLIAKLRGSEKAIIRDGLNPSWFDPGLLYVCVVGLLNLVVMMSVLDGRALSAAASTEPAPAPAAPPSVAKVSEDKPAAAVAPGPVIVPAPAPEKTA